MISAYTKIYNGIENKYPWERSINSMLSIADEVVVLDSGSNDGTFEALQAMADKEDKISLSQYKICLDDEDFAHQGDGLQKARARKLCTKDLLFQFDCDEIIARQQAEKTKKLCRNIFSWLEDGTIEEECVFFFPMIEFWGKNKFRVDIPFYKSRISFNTSKVTHDIPKNCRGERENGTPYSKASDGCDYVLAGDLSFIKPFCPIPLDQMAFIDRARNNDLGLYENSLLKLVDQVGTIYHFSWYDIPRKIRTYKDYWSEHWNSLFNQDISDTADNNNFFDKPWSEVSDQEIEELGAKLEEEMGGWIFHERIDFSRKTPWIETKRFKEAGFDIED